MSVRRSRGAVAVASLALAIVVVAILVGCAPEQARVTSIPAATAAAASPSVSPSGTAGGASPTAAAPATATPTSGAPTPVAFATITPQRLDVLVPAQTHGIGQLSGDWVFLLRRSTVFGTLPHSSGGEQIAATDYAVDSLTLVPLARPDTGAVTVATFLSEIGHGIAATNLISAQLSPDGDRVVLSVATKGPQGGDRLGLVIIDLASGAMFDLTTDPSFHDDTPAWSRDGRTIAFTRRSVSDGSDAGIWAVAPQPGSPVRGPFLRPVNVAGRRSFVYSWAPDGAWLAISRGNDRYEYFNVPPESCGTPGV